MRIVLKGKTFENKEEIKKMGYEWDGLYWTAAEPKNIKIEGVQEVYIFQNEDDLNRFDEIINILKNQVNPNYIRKEIRERVGQEIDKRHMIEDIDIRMKFAKQMNRKLASIMDMKF